MTLGTKRFTTFVQNAPAASAPSVSDYVALAQGDITKKFPLMSIVAFCEPTVITAGATYALGQNDAFLAVSKTSLTNIQLLAGLTSGRTLVVADCGGYAGDYPITITPGSGDEIDGMPFIRLISAWQVTGLQYIPALHLWKVF